MDILVACDIFQWAMGTLFQYLKHLFVYLDDLITLGSESFDGQLAEIDEVLYRLLTKELQVNFAFWSIGTVLNPNLLKYRQ